ncbi:tetratricopeptide repeat protein [Planctomycetota bacterium]
MKKIVAILVLLIILVTPVLAETETSQKAQQHFENANELLKRMDYEAAITEYGQVIHLSPSSKIAQDAEYWIGQSHFRAGRFDAAQATFAKLIQKYPTSAIVPVTKLMVERVEQTKKTEEKRRVMSSAVDKGFLIDPETGVRYTKTVALVGKNDVIEDTTYPNRLDIFQLSPNSKFILYGKLVVPLDGSTPFDLVDISATRCTWSPDGKNVAFYSEDGIYIVPVSPETSQPTGPVRKLLDGRYSWGLVSWAPDGKKFAFRRMGEKKGGVSTSNIWTLSIEDGSLTQITNDTANVLAPAWSPDGKTIAYAKKEDRLSFWLIAAEGGVTRKIVEPGGRCIPFWSPDGKWIMYTLEDKVHLLDPNINQELEIIPPREVVGDFFSWSPDGKKMLFYHPSYHYKYGLRVASASGGPPIDIGRELNEIYPEQKWSPDSKLLIGGGGHKDGRYGLWISPLSGGESVLLEIDVSVNGSPRPFSVSPDGEKLALTVERGDGTKDLFVAPISLQDARAIDPAIKIFDRWYAAPGVPASWSPDGSKFAVIHRGDLWIAFSSGDKPIQITKTPELEHGCGWSPDGKMVRYIVRHSQTERTSYVASVSDGKTTKILDTGPGRIRAWSPDSKKLAIESEGLISLVSIADGGIQQIAELKNLNLERIFDISWSPDGKYIACVGKHIEKGDAGPIFMIPVAGGEVTTLVDNDTSSKYVLHWSPDSRWISYNSEGSIKVRPEGTMWEADFEEIVKKASQ